MNLEEDNWVSVIPIDFGIRTDCKHFFYYSVDVPTRKAPMMRHSCSHEKLAKGKELIKSIKTPGCILQTNDCKNCRYFELHPSRKGIMK